MKKSGFAQPAKFLAFAFSLAFVSSIPTTAFAQIPTSQTSPLLLVGLLAILALMPFILVMITSFVKIAVVLSLLRSAIGAQQVPPNQVITGLAIVLSIYIMAPVGHEIYTEIRPTLDTFEASDSQTIDDYEEIGTKALMPVKSFLLKHADVDERILLFELAKELRTAEQQAQLKEDDAIILVPAFVLTELKEAFIIGFILFVPFLVVDLVVANVLLSLGMHMLSPTTVSLPFKLLLFVLVDGWYLVIKGLVLGYV